MHRPVIYDQSQGRDYDVLTGWREGLFGLGQATLDLLGSASTIVAGFAATPTGPASLSINLAAGDIYAQADVDATTYGSLAADTTQTMQQGFAAAQVLNLSTSGLGSGQSRWALVQCAFSQTDVIPSDDPTGGLLSYLNTSNPSGAPWSGPNNDGETQPTRRQGLATISVIYGTVASTGTEVPPNPSSGNVPLYLIDLAFGQTTITSGEILVAGPSVGANVPSNYVQAPFLAGLLKSHHSGGAGQAPKINLATETVGVLPISQMVPIRNFKAGFILSNDGTNPNTKIDVSAGQASDSTNAVSMSNTSAMAIDFTTVGAGGLDTGSLTASHSYACFAIFGSSGISTVAHDSTGATSAPVPTLPSGYTYYRYIGTVVADGSAHILPFKQDGDIIWYGAIKSVHSVPTTAASLVSIGTPPGISVMPIARWFTGNAATGRIALTSPSEPDTGPSTDSTASPGFDLDDDSSPAAAFNEGPAGTLFIKTDLQGRIRARSSNGSGTDIYVYMRGYVEDFGRNS